MTLFDLRSYFWGQNQQFPNSFETQRKKQQTTATATTTTLDGETSPPLHTITTTNENQLKHVTGIGGGQRTKQEEEARRTKQISSIEQAHSSYS